MKTLLHICLLFAAALGGMWLLKDHHDQVMWVSNEARYSMSLLSFVVLCLLVFVVLYVLVRIMARLWHSPRYWWRWQGQRLVQKEFLTLEHAWLAYTQGDSKKAQQWVQKVLRKGKTPERQLSAGILAARLAHERGDFAQRDIHLQTAEQANALQDIPNPVVAMVRAELYLQQGLVKPALQSLDMAVRQGAKQVQVQRLYLQALSSSSDILLFMETARLLRKQQAISQAEFDAQMSQQVSAHIRSLPPEQGAHFYQGLTSYERALPDIVLAAARCHEQLEQFDKATQLLVHGIQKTQSPLLLEHYAKAPESVLRLRLQKAQQWLQQYPDNLPLLRCLAQLCLLGKLWGQAEYYLKQHEALGQGAKWHALFGLLHDRQGNLQQALYHWRLASLGASGLVFDDANIMLVAADTSADPLPPDVKNLNKLDDRFLSARLETVSPETAPVSTS